MPSEAIKFETGRYPAVIKAGWIAALDRRLGWDDLPRSYRLLNAVLHAVDACRDEKPTRRCGAAWEDAAHERPDVPVFLQQVATGFKPDCLDNPENAVLVVIEVIDDLIDEPDLGRLRDALARPTPLDPAAVKWSRVHDAVTTGYLR